nr:MAG TPA: hypothetical protein [Caudoviricetes sp.]
MAGGPILFFENFSAQTGSSPSVRGGRQQTTPAFREVKNRVQHQL